jgi:hypothetical protein
MDDMTEERHAVLAIFRADPSRAAEQLIGLERFIVPSVAGSPGFIRGEWVSDESATERIAFILMDSAADARSLCENVRANAEGQKGVGLELLSIRPMSVDVSA